MKVLKQISEEALLPYQRRKPISFDIEVVSIDLTGGCQGKNAVVKTVVDDVEKALLFEEGHTVLEFDFPAVEKDWISKVSVYVNGMLKYIGNPKHLPQKTIRPSDFVNPFMGTNRSLWMIFPVFG